MSTVDKKTKVDYFNEILEVINNQKMEEEVRQEYIDFIDKQIEILLVRADKARERARKNKEKSDDLTKSIKAVLDDNFRTIAEIEQLVLKIHPLDDGESLTMPMITARLSKLYKEGSIEKTQMKSSDGRKLMHYKSIYSNTTDISKDNISDDELGDEVGAFMDVAEIKSIPVKQAAFLEGTMLDPNNY